MWDDRTRKYYLHVPSTLTFVSSKGKCFHLRDEFTRIQIFSSVEELSKSNKNGVCVNNGNPSSRKCKDFVCCLGLLFKIAEDDLEEIRSTSPLIIYCLRHNEFLRREYPSFPSPEEIRGMCDCEENEEKMCEKLIDALEMKMWR